MYFDHAAVEWPLTLSALLGCALWVFRVVRRKRCLLRIPLGAASILVVIASSFLLLMDGCSLAWDVTDTPVRVYSPDRRHVILVRDRDWGAVGGDTYIDLYSFHGFLEQTIAGGQWKIVEAKDVEWTFDGEVVLHYDNSYRIGPSCEST